VNESIRFVVRAVFPDGTTEVMPTAQALRKAQDMGSTSCCCSHCGASRRKAVTSVTTSDLKKKQHDARRNSTSYR
jgi:hypothetical protein